MQTREHMGTSYLFVVGHGTNHCIAMWPRLLSSNNVLMRASRLMLCWVEHSLFLFDIYACEVNIISHQQPSQVKGQFFWQFSLHWKLLNAKFSHLRNFLPRRKMHFQTTGSPHWKHLYSRGAKIQCAGPCYLYFFRTLVPGWWPNTAPTRRWNHSCTRRISSSACDTLQCLWCTSKDLSTHSAPLGLWKAFFNQHLCSDPGVWSSSDCWRRGLIFHPQGVALG